MRVPPEVLVLALSFPIDGQADDRGACIEGRAAASYGEDDDAVLAQLATDAAEFCALAARWSWIEDHLPLAPVPIYAAVMPAVEPAAWAGATLIHSPKTATASYLSCPGSVFVDCERNPHGAIAATMTYATGPAWWRRAAVIHELQHVAFEDRAALGAPCTGRICSELAAYLSTLDIVASSRPLRVWLAGGRTADAVAAVLPALTSATAERMAVYVPHALSERDVSPESVLGLVTQIRSRCRSRAARRLIDDVVVPMIDAAAAPDARPAGATVIEAR